MKYHVNPDTGKVGPCRAKKKCRFGGSSGSDNHFDSQPAAEKAAETLMSSKHKFSSLKKQSEAEGFGTLRDSIRSGLAQAGLNARSLPSVSSEQEIVDKWFGGDRNKFELIARISNPNTHLTKATRDSVNGFVKKGTAVGFASTVEDLTESARGSESQVSEVDLIDDFGGPIDLKELASGKLRAF